MRTHGGEKVELMAVCVRRVDDGRARSETTAGVEQLDRSQAVLGEALLDLARLLVGVGVQRQVVLGGVTAELLEPVAWTGADGVGSDADADPIGSQLFELTQVRGHRLLAEALDPSARVRDVKEDELDLRLGRSLGGRARLLEPEIVELADGGVPGTAELPVDVRVARPHVLRRLTAGELEHRLAPRPEVLALGPSAQRTLEGVAMGVDEPGDPLRVRHAQEDTAPRTSAARRRLCRLRLQP